MQRIVFRVQIIARSTAKLLLELAKCAWTVAHVKTDNVPSKSYQHSPAWYQYELNFAYRAT